jgi:hypothetical protein
MTGKRVTVLESPGETNGELLRFEYVLLPRFSIPEHVRPRQEERHEVLRDHVGDWSGATVRAST